MNIKEAIDLIGSIHNRCEIIEDMTDERGSILEGWLATLIEDIYEDAQELIEFCEVEDGDKQ